MTDEEIAALTPKRYRLLLARWRVEQKRRDWRAGVIASILKAAHAKRGARTDPGQWFPSLAPRPQSSDDMLAVFTDIAVSHNAGLRRGDHSRDNPH